MLFNSYIFILLFLPVSLIGYFTLNHFGRFRLASAFLLCMSLWFYAYFNLSYLPIILCSIAVNFLIYKAFDRLEGPLRKALMIFGVAADLAVLFYFKYFDFFLENLNSLFGTDLALRGILLPLGISFFTFQQMSFVIDSYQRKVPRYDFLNYALFVTFFPQLIAGPIVTHDELVPQLLDEEKRRFSWENFERGMYMFSLGLAKKVLLADVFGNAVNYCYANSSSLNTPEACVAVVGYAFQIFLDFSGYSDMAIGLGKMMNIDLPVNFDSSYKGITIDDYWKRNHKTLTRFLTRYLYIPLGGSRRGELRTYVNIMIVYLVSGLWHGADWTFVFWGGLNGLFLCITKYFKSAFDRIPRAVNWCITFTFVNLGLVFFRADNFAQALEILRCLFSFDFSGQLFADRIISSFALTEFRFVFSDLLHLPLFDHQSIYMAVYFLFTWIACVFLKNPKQRMDEMQPGAGPVLTTVFLLTWCIFSFTGVSTFLYFNF